MSQANRDQLLEEKRQETEEKLTIWTEEVSLLSSGERITFTIAIERTPVVVGRIDDQVVQRSSLLPSDSGRAGDVVTSFRLSEEDWEEIIVLPFLTDQEKEIVNWLYHHQNGPLVRSEYSRMVRSESLSNVTRWVNEKLERINTYVIGQSGRHFHFGQIQSSPNYWAIAKIGFFEPT